MFIVSILARLTPRLSIYAVYPACPRSEQGATVAVSTLSSPLTKNILLPMLARNTINLPPSCPPEGRIAIVTDVGWDAVDAAVSRVA
jgi:hypothetical protein